VKYHNITKDDMLNGDGLRTVLWVSGCNHHCVGCQNPMTWDHNDGLVFDDAAKKEIFDQLDQNYIAGVTLSGGDPLHPSGLLMYKEYCSKKIFLSQCCIVLIMIKKIIFQVAVAIKNKCEI